MATEGNGAHEEYVPVWLPVEQWKVVKRCMYAEMGVSYETLCTVSDAIKWAESR